MLKCLEHLPLKNRVADSIGALDVLGEQDLAQHLVLESSEVLTLLSPSLGSFQCLGLECVLFERLECFYLQIHKQQAIGLEEEAVILLRFWNLQIIGQLQIDPPLVHLFTSRKFLIWKFSPNIRHQGMEATPNHSHCTVNLHPINHRLADLQLLRHLAPSMEDFALQPSIKLHFSYFKFIFAFMSIPYQRIKIFLEQLLTVYLFSNSFLILIILLDQNGWFESQQGLFECPKFMLFRSLLLILWLLGEFMKSDEDWKLDVGIGDLSLEAMGDRFWSSSISLIYRELPQCEEALAQPVVKVIIVSFVLKFSEVLWI